MERNRVEKIKEMFDSSERIGVIGSPSSTSEIAADILGTAVNKRLVGNLCVFNYLQDGRDHFALGQITEVGMRNIWAEDPTMRSLIRQKGSVEPITERQDYHYAKIGVSSVFSVTSKVEPSMFGTVPSTGTSVRLMSEKLMLELLQDFRNEFTFLGRVYGTEMKMPMWFKHFGEPPEGAGEAYHIGIFGKTGSGKSVLSKMILIAYAKNANMTIFVLDPQGEFTNLKKDEKVLQLIGSNYGIEVEFISLQNLVLTGEDLFKKILVNSGFLERVSVYHPDNRARAADQIVSILKRKRMTLDGSVEGIKPWEYFKRESFDLMWDKLQQPDILKNIYSNKDGQDRMLSSIQNANKEEMYTTWRKICNLFAFQNEDKRKISKLVEQIDGESKGRIIIIDLSETSVSEDIFWNDSIRKIVIDQFLKSLANVAQNRYKEGKLLNALIVMDEAHRLAPRQVPEDDEITKSLKSTIVDGVRTTRKYGLGWMFISQTLSSLDREIINQLRIYIFGYGLAYGAEREALKEIVGGVEGALNLYELFKDPQSGFGEKEYPFMAFGPISPLSFSFMPLFFNALSFPSEFLGVNFGIGKGNE